MPGVVGPKPLVTSITAKYLQSWLTWAETGAPHGDPYRRTSGLCGNAYFYEGGVHYQEINLNLKQLWLHEGLDLTYPFGEKSYDWAVMRGTSHLDQARLAWIRKHLE